ncbi:hypothetical protein HG530_011114 [Fusarium avenaceum]|nr:hypothetical protein HG530_011114 [Fusarium avenaceum]
MNVDSNHDNGDAHEKCSEEEQYEEEDNGGKIVDTTTIPRDFSFHSYLDAMANIDLSQIGQIGQAHCEAIFEQHGEIVIKANIDHLKELYGDLLSEHGRE